jgi:hypothetical protein
MVWRALNRRGARHVGAIVVGLLTKPNETYETCDS